MPQKIDDCVSGMMADWAKDPSKKPKTNKATGKPVSSAADMKSVAIAICQKSLKLHNEQVAEMETGGGPALVAAAITAKPHLRQRGDDMEIKIVERNGIKLVRVPLFRKGIYRHPNGTLLFDDGFIDRMIENHKAKVTDYPPILDFRHDEKMGALAFLDPDDGGFLEREDDKLIAYGPPTDESAEKVINSRKWRFASAEFYKNYKSNLMQKLSAETLEEIQPIDILEVMKMPKQIKVGEYTVNINEDGGVLALGESDVSTLEKVALEFGQGKDAMAKVVTLEARVRELEGHTEPELPAEAKIKLEAMQGELAKLQAEREAEKAQRTREQVAVALEKARNYKDANGNAHAPVFLNLIEKGMLLQEFESGDDKIALEAKADNVAVVSYYRKLLKVMLETCPGALPATGKTEGSEEQLGEKPLPSFTEDELKAELEAFHKNY